MRNKGAQTEPHILRPSDGGLLDDLRSAARQSAIHHGRKVSNDLLEGPTEVPRWASARLLSGQKRTCLLMAPHVRSTAKS